jgi:hypothetical protein
MLSVVLAPTDGVAAVVAETGWTVVMTKSPIGL